MEKQHRKFHLEEMKAAHLLFQTTKTSAGNKRLYFTEMDVGLSKTEMAPEEARMALGFLGYIRLEYRRT